MPSKPKRQRPCATGKVAAASPNWPRSFLLGVKGAASIGGQLYVFKEGWYMQAANPANRAKLADINGWPAAWDGTLDAVVQLAEFQVLLVKGTQGVKIDFSGNAPIATAPVPASTVLPQGIAGLDAGFVTATGDWFIFNGTEVSFGLASAPLQKGYAGAVFSQWPTLWNPVLNHAPAGRTGNLWVATATGDVISHDGENWQSASVNPKAHSVSAGVDGSVWTARPAFSLVYSQGDPGIWIAGYDLKDPADRIFAFDGDGSGKQDHLVLYRPGQSKIYRP